MKLLLDDIRKMDNESIYKKLLPEVNSIFAFIDKRRI